MNKLLFFVLLVLTQRGFSQCPFPVTLGASANCAGDTLFITTTNESLSKIVWYNGASIVQTVTVNTNATGVTVAGGNGYGPAANQFFYPQCVFLDATGNVYVDDADNERIQKFPPGSTGLTNGLTVAGGNGGGSGANQFDMPIGICIDVNGNIYVADDLNERIQKWAPGATSGVTVAGGNGAGTAANQFHNPYDVYVDATGNIYVADWLNERVQKFPPGSTSTTNGVTVAGGNGAGSGANQLNGPTNVFVDGSGNVYVTDRTNERIQKWAPGATSGVTVAGGNGIGSAANQLDAPFGIYVDTGGNLYVADFSNSRIQKFPPGSTGASNGVTVAGGNGFGNASNQFSGPASVFVAGNGDLYVVDLQNERIQKWATEKIDTNYVATTAGTYTAIVTDSSGCSDTTNPIVIIPTVTTGISIAESGNTLCSGEGTFITTITGGGTAPRFQWQMNGIDVGTDSAAFHGMNLANADAVRCILTGNAACSTNPSDTSNTINISAAPMVTLKSPGGNCLGDTLVVSTKDSLEQIIWYNGAVGVDTSRAVLQDSGMTVAGGNGVGYAGNQLNRPYGVFVDSHGIIYVADQDNGRVQMWVPGATSGVTVARSGLASPMAVFVDANGYLYVSDIVLNSVQKFPPGSTGTTPGITVAGGNGPGYAANQLNSPTSIFVDAKGDLYVADQFNERVQKFAAGSTSATPGVTVASNLGNPVGIFVDASGNLYICESGYNEITKWAPGASSGVIVAGGYGAGAATNQFNAADCIFVDVQGNIYIADEMNNRILKWAPGAGSGITVAGWNGAGLAANQLSYPFGLFVDSNENIYASDLLKNSVQKWSQKYSADSIYIPPTAGSYTAVVTNSSGCSATSNPVIINPIVTPQISITSSDTDICTGSVITFKATATNRGVNPKYQWQVNGNNVAGANNTTYTSDSIQNGSLVRCILTSNAPCTSIPSDTSDNIIITVANPVTPSISISASQTNICPGTLVTFNATMADAGSQPLYQWQVNGSNAASNIPAFTSSTLINGDVVSCVMTGNAACATANTSTSNPITMNVAPLVTPSVTLSATANNICSGTPVMFTVIPTNGGNVPSFQWMINGIPSGSNSPTFANNTLHNGDDIFCIMTSSLACTSPDSSSVVKMTVYPLPLVTFNPDTVYTTSNSGIQLTPILSGAITQYQWSPSSYLDNTTLANPVANPSSEIRYQLLVTTENGCTATGKVTVIAGRPLNIPNAFTPNGDGHNDIFRIPPGVQFNLEELDIFDGWGNKVFTTRDITKGWDGIYLGSPAVMGVYVYLITGKTLAGKPVFIKGTFLLIR